jgi:hypothetical protein
LSGEVGEGGLYFRFGLEEDRKLHAGRSLDAASCRSAITFAAGRAVVVPSR